MQLIYRGTTYDYNPAHTPIHYPLQHTRQSAYELVYRGSTFRVKPTVTAKAPVDPVSYELIYRGNTYQVNRNEQGKMTAIAPVSASSYRASKHNRPALQ
jgi:Domain of unknown function (DUF4278)